MIYIINQYSLPAKNLLYKANHKINLNSLKTTIIIQILYHKEVYKEVKI